MPDIAFFDVDETLTIPNGMHAFLGTYRPLNIEPSVFSGRVKALLALQDAGADRETISTGYFRLFEGESWAHLRAEGARWVAEAREAGPFFIDETLARLRAHQDAGDVVVFVSGSFDALIHPVAEAVGADWVYCTTVTRPGGVLDGRTTGTMVGANKAAAVLDAATHLGVDPSRCSAYGDHVSDLPMLEAVGLPVAVLGAKPDLELFHHATTAGWDTIRHLS